MSRSPRGGGNPHPARRCRVRMPSSNLQDTDSAQIISGNDTSISGDRRQACHLCVVMERGEERGIVRNGSDPEEFLEKSRHERISQEFSNSSAATVMETWDWT